MGCDIHCNLEYRRNSQSNWYDIDLYKRNKYFGQDGDEIEEFEKVKLYNERSYFLFGLLAGVRNHMVEPIKQPRGIPEDVSESVKNIMIQKLVFTHLVGIHFMNLKELRKLLMN